MDSRFPRTTDLQTGDCLCFKFQEEEERISGQQHGIWVAATKYITLEMDFKKIYLTEHPEVGRKGEICHGGVQSATPTRICLPDLYSQLLAIQKYHHSKVDWVDPT